MFPSVQLEPLRQYRVFETRDASVFRHALISGLRARSVELDPDGDLMASGRIAPLKTIELSHYQCNKRVTVEFDRTTSYWFVHHGETGRLQVRIDGQQLPINDTSSCLIPAGTQPRLEGQGDLLVLRIKARPAAHRLAFVGAAKLAPLHRMTAATLQNDQNCVRLLLGLMSLLNLELDRPEPNPAVVDGLENAILVAFARLGGAATPAEFQPDFSTARADHAAGYINAHLSRPVTMNELSAVTKVSPRTLLRAFQKTYGCTPMAYAKRQRLVRAHDVLADAASDVGVTSVALRLGFQNVGRFSQDYREMFGELPSRTAARVRGRG